MSSCALIHSQNHVPTCPKIAAASRMAMTKGPTLMWISHHTNSPNANVARFTITMPGFRRIRIRATANERPYITPERMRSSRGVRMKTARVGPHDMMKKSEKHVKYMTPQPKPTSTDWVPMKAHASAIVKRLMSTENLLWRMWQSCSRVCAIVLRMLSANKIVLRTVAAIEHDSNAFRRASKNSCPLPAVLEQNITITSSREFKPAPDARTSPAQSTWSVPWRERISRYRA
mmetsp:Transcript_4917/g.11876  ORF Transcript_4917/g.11876 Transcript_4917/m.11876 type:complete len:231 (+) Transcript_4917:977-1669(+)|eukprot:175500-Rhodomonas_salina.2